MIYVITENEFNRAVAATNAITNEELVRYYNKTRKSYPDESSKWILFARLINFYLEDTAADKFFIDLERNRECTPVIGTSSRGQKNFLIKATQEPVRHRNITFKQLLDAFKFKDLFNELYKNDFPNEKKVVQSKRYSLTSIWRRPQISVKPVAVTISTLSSTGEIGKILSEEKEVEITRVVESPKKDSGLQPAASPSSNSVPTGAIQSPPRGQWVAVGSQLAWGTTPPSAATLPNINSEPHSSSSLSDSRRNTR